MGKYIDESKRLLECVGGRENIAAVTHCVTRMRFVLKDTAKANKEEIEKYGVFQRVQEQDGNNEVYLQVNSILKGIQESSDLTTDGNIYLMSGYSVPLKIKTISKLNLTFLIESDRHVWTSNDYYTQISLAFENVMNDVDISSTKKKEEFEVIPQNKPGAGDPY